MLIAALLVAGTLAAEPPRHQVTITRDDWGIAHVDGVTDADAVFGAIYAQAEDDFNRIETNYLNALGRSAEADGEQAIWRDLRQRLFVDPDDLKAKYAESPPWLRKLMDAWAEGLNFYLATHPETQPRAIRRFEPWMALSFTEGSIGGDVERVNIDALRSFYDRTETTVVAANEPGGFVEPSGSNGFALGPSITQGGRALLLINPHTSFYFRSELQMKSREGLNAYGAATWGQFFIYQGFNPAIGWMHTSTGADNVDEFAETIVRRPEGLFYRYGAEERPLKASNLTLNYRTPDGAMASRSFEVFHTHRGPIVRRDGERWMTAALMNRPLEALQQSYLRTKATGLASYIEVGELRANSTNNTLLATSKGEVAFLMPQFTPRRDDRFDYTRPVDGSDPATDWRGLHALKDLPRVITPLNGWIFNVNDGPYNAAGADSPRAGDFPRYLDAVGANARTAQAKRVLGQRRDFTLETLVAAAYDPYMPTFATLVPCLIAAYEAKPDPTLAAPIEILKSWNFEWSETSVATSLAVFWGEAMWDRSRAAGTSGVAPIYRAMAAAEPDAKLDALRVAVRGLTAEFGDWRTPWGEVNRLQRNDGAIVQTFDDAKPSLPVPFTSAQWGSLASFGARSYPGTHRRYGVSGNSFVAAVEFGPRVRAVAINVGGSSGQPASAHFRDQDAGFVGGKLRPIYFYPADLKGHVESRYRPGEARPNALGAAAVSAQ